MKDFIIKKIFDIKPTNKKGEIDYELIYKVEKILDLKRLIEKHQRLLKIPVNPIQKKNRIHDAPVKFLKTERISNKLDSKEYIIQELSGVFKEIEKKEKILKAKLEKLKLDKIERTLIKKVSQNTIEEYSDIEKIINNYSKTKTSINIIPEKIKTTEKDFGPKKILNESFEIVSFKNSKKQEKQKIQKRAYSFKISFQNLGGKFVLVIFSIFIVTNLVFFGLKAQINKQEIVTKAFEGFKNLYQAQASFNNISIDKFLNSKSYLETAYINFLDASQELESLGKEILKVLALISPNEVLTSGYYTVYLGKDLSSAGKSMVNAFELLAKIDIGYVFDINAKTQNSNQEILTPAKIINGVGFYLKDANNYLTSAQNNLNKISLNAIPVEYRKDFIKLKDSLPKTRKNIELLSSNFGIFGDILGINGSKKYLILFENNSEMRATGGFIGSYALATINNASLEDIKVDDIYNIDGQLEAKIIPPKPIQKISTAWSTHDANWFLDFPTSAKKISWFFEKTGNPTPDSIIAITPKFIEDILKITGPIEIKDENFIVDSSNFLDLLQYKVEDLDRKTGNPKKILAKLTSGLLQKLANLDNNNLKNSIKTFNDNIKEKNILFYFKDKESENLADLLNINGKLVSKQNSDFLALVNSNLNGFKTDKLINQRINLEVNIKDDGSISNILKVSRKHLGGDLAFDWYNKVNSDYFRVYAPENSVYITAQGHTKEKIPDPIDYLKSGFKEDEDVVKINANSVNIDGIDIFKESGKTVFGSWLYVSPKEEVDYTIEYAPPFKIMEDKIYSLYIQKQPGQENNEISVKINYPNNFIIKEKSDNLTIGPNNSLVFNSGLRQDEEISIKLANNY